MYYVINEGGSATPTPAQIVAGTDANGNGHIGKGSGLIAKGSVAAPNVINEILRYDPYNVTITGLHPKSTYDLYVVAMDDEASPYGGNLQGLATQITFKAASTDAHMGGLLAREARRCAG